MVDKEDLERIKSVSNLWFLDKKAGYAQRAFRLGGTVRLHRVIMNLVDAGKAVHHINGNRLDNRKSNLMILSHREHQILESGTKRGTASKYLGVTKCGNRYRVRLKRYGISIFDKTFDSETEAALAYNEFIVKAKLPHKLNSI